MQVSAEYAQEHFAELLTVSDSGEAVEICREGKPAYRLTQVSPARATHAKQPRQWGVAAGEIWLSPDWDSPEVNAEIADEFERSEIFPRDASR